MKNNYFQYYKPNVIIGFIVILGSGIGAIVTSLIKIFNESLDFSYYQYPTASVFIAILIYAIDKWLWQFIPFSYLFSIPDISGRYEGEIRYHNPKSNQYESKLCIVEIFQTGSKVKVSSFFQNPIGQEQTPSNSLIETVVKNEDDTYSLIFTYRNQGIPGGFAGHNGTNILKLIDNESGRFLKGVYYTNREPYQTQGRMEVKFITKKIKNDF